MHWLFRRLLSALDKPRNSTVVKTAPTVSWLLEHQRELQGKMALTRGNTPLASLYRMYEYIVIGYNIGLRNEIEAFFNHHTWPVSAIPDPKDPDPQRYAVLAVLPYYLVMAFNRLIEIGLPRDSPFIITPEIEEELKSRERVLEEEPRWVLKVPRLEETLVIPRYTGEIPRENCLSGPFAKMNIRAENPHNYTICLDVKTT